MSGQPTPGSPSVTPPEAESVVTVRPLRYADLDGVTAGDEEAVLYLVRNHAGVESLDRAEVSATSSEPVYAREHRKAPEQHASVGVKRTVAAQTVYGSETTVHLYSSSEAVEADFPPASTGAATAARERAMAKQSDPGVYLEDTNGSRTLPVTPDWGSQVYVSALMPDVDPDTLAAAVERALDEQFPGHRLLKLQSRWVADRRVNVYRPELQRGPQARTQDSSRGLLEANVLEAEGIGLGRSFPIEQVAPQAPPPDARG